MTALDAAMIDALADALKERIGRDRSARLIDAKAAGAQLGVPSTWLLAEARANRVPHVRLGRYVRFSPEQLAEWTESQVRGPRVLTNTTAPGRNVRGRAC
jgi:hypothetical protein